MNPKKKRSRCLFCGNEVNRHEKIYCNTQCQHNYLIQTKVLSGKANHRTLKRYLIMTRGYKCECCGLSEWRQLPITLELEHIDGNSENGSLDNLMLLCPNCHAQTPTYKGKNKGHGRYFRRVKYAEGKSY